MPIEIRQRTESELETFRITSEIAFGESVRLDPESTREWLSRHEMDRDFAAFENGQMVGTAGAYSARMTVPGGGSIPVAAITDVTVLPTHNRRGIGTMLTRDQLQRVRDRGETGAALWASESIIYGRWGYGMAMQTDAVSIDTRHSRFQNQVSTGGNMRIVDVDEAARTFPGVWERATSRWPGFMTRKPEFLYRTLRSPNPEPSPGESSLFMAVYEESGSIDGYVMYRFLRGTDESSLKIIELIPTADKAHAALWRYCFDVDLIWRVSYDLTPIDDPLWWMLADPRRLKRTRYDAIWLRIVDVPAALSARKYASAGKLVIEVVDEFCPWAGGSFELDATETGASCMPTRNEPDLVMSAADLSAGYLGGGNFGAMARAARVEERTYGALKRADAMFAAERAPWCPWDF